MIKKDGAMYRVQIEVMHYNKERQERIKKVFLFFTSYYVGCENTNIYKLDDYYNMNDYIMWMVKFVKKW